MLCFIIHDGGRGKAVVGRGICYERRGLMLVMVMVIMMVMMVSQCDVVTSYRKVIMVMVVHIAVRVIVMMDNNTARITT